MPPKLSLPFVVEYLKKIIPEYEEMLTFIERQSGKINLPAEFNLALEKLKIENYPELYQDELKLKKMALLAVMPAEQINATIKQIEQLPEDQRTEPLESFITQLIVNGDAIIDNLPDTEEEKQAAQKEFNEMTPDEQAQAVRQAQIAISAFVPAFFNTMSMMVHGRKLTSLVTAAESGDDQAFCLAVQIDKRILSALPYFQNRQNKAQIEGDTDFLDKLNYRLTNPLLRGKIRHKTLWLTFAILDMSGYLDSSLTYEELLKICADVGVAGYPNRVGDESALGKRLREYRRFQEINQRSRH